MRRFTLADIGCYADGTFGLEHVREQLAKLLREARYAGKGLSAMGPIGEINESLSGPMPDDAWDELEAIDLLNEHACDPSVHFTFDSGDLLLVASTDNQGDE